MARKKPHGMCSFPSPPQEPWACHPPNRAWGLEKCRVRTSPRPCHVVLSRGSGAAPHKPLLPLSQVVDDLVSLFSSEVPVVGRLRRLWMAGGAPTHIPPRGLLALSWRMASSTILAACHGNLLAPSPGTHSYGCVSGHQHHGVCLGACCDAL